MNSPNAAYAPGRDSFFRSGTSPGASGKLDRWVLARIRDTVKSAPVRFALWDGYALPPESRQAIGTILFKSRAALRSWLRNPELYFGETYMAGTVEVQGELVEVLEAIYRAFGTPRPRWWRHSSNGARASRENVHHHYDLGNAFYRLWLDREMVYTCAYFPEPDATLEDAQIAKMDLVCRKLQLRPGDRVIEAGCGWGSLALFMARRYGVTVRAFNVSSEQIAFARKRAREEGLSDRVEFVEDDYRNVRGKYDAFVSVGMLEHVGIRHYQTLGQIIDRTLSDRGRGLLHFIGRDRPAPINAWIRKRIFPGGYVPALREVCERVLEPAALSVCDVENLRWHYARTLNHWRRRFEAAEDQVAAMFDAPFVRAWRLYLAGSEASFTTGSLQLFQVLFIRSDGEPLDWMRVTR